MAYGHSQTVTHNFLTDIQGISHYQQLFSLLSPSTVNKITIPFDMFSNEVAGLLPELVPNTFNSDGVMAGVNDTFKCYYTGPIANDFTFVTPDTISANIVTATNYAYIVKDVSLLYAGIDTGSLDDQYTRPTVDIEIDTSAAGGYYLRQVTIQALQDYGTDQTLVDRPDYDYQKEGKSWTTFQIFHDTSATTVLATGGAVDKKILNGLQIPRYARWLRIQVEIWYVYPNIHTVTIPPITFKYVPSKASITGEGGIVGDGTGQRGWHSYYNLFAAFADWSKQSILQMTQVNNVTLYRGTEDQISDPAMEVALNSPVPAYIDRAHIVFDTLQLANFGNRIPNLTFETVRYENDTAAGIIEDLMDIGEVDEKYYDLTALPVTGDDAFVAGYTIGTQTSIRDAITAMLDVFDIDAADIMNQIVFRPRRRTAIDYIISTDDLDAKTPGSSPSPLIEYSYADIMELPRSLSISYSDPGRDYQINNAIYVRDQSGPNTWINKKGNTVKKSPSTQTSTAEYPVVSYPRIMKDAVVRRMQDAWTQKNTAKFKLPHKYVQIAPTDIISLRDNSATHYDQNIEVLQAPFGGGVDPRPGLLNGSNGVVHVYSPGVWLGAGNVGYMSTWGGLGVEAIPGGNGNWSGGIFYQDFDLGNYLTDDQIAAGGHVAQFCIDGEQQYSGYNLVWEGSHGVLLYAFKGTLDANGNTVPDFNGYIDAYGTGFVEIILGTTNLSYTTGKVTFQLPAGTRFVRCQVYCAAVLASYNGQYFENPILNLALKTDKLPIYSETIVKLTTVTRGADGILQCEGTLYKAPRRAGDLNVLSITGNAGTSQYISPVGSATIKLANTILYLMDIPAIRSTENDAGFYVGFAAEDGAWEGAEFYRSLDSGATYVDISTNIVPIVAGKVVSGALLGAIDCRVPDITSSIVVQLYNSDNELTSVTSDALLSGSNLALIGNELVSFLTATHLTGNQFQLNGAFIRGIAGTDRSECTDTHVVNEEFVLLQQAALVNFTDDLANRNRPMSYKAVTIGINTSDVAAETFTNTAQRLFPYSPCFLGGTRDGSNNLTIVWTRRDRFGIAWPDYIDIPNSEAYERYEIDVYDGTFATVLRTIVVNDAQTIVYSAADQTTDGLTPGNHVNIMVYQISDKVGRGHPAKGIV
jgi:hypothetical protein